MTTIVGVCICGDFSVPVKLFFKWQADSYQLLVIFDLSTIDVFSILDMEHTYFQAKWNPQSQEQLKIILPSIETLVGNLKQSDVNIIKELTNVSTIVVRHQKN